MDYKIIVLDLDGTLTNRDKIITKRTKDALMKAQQAGKIVVLASGRPTYGIVALAEELCLREYGGYVLSFNGGNIVNCQTGEVVFQREIPTSANQNIIRLAKEHNVNILTYEKNKIITNDATDPYAQKECAINRLQAEQIDDMENHMDFAVPKYLMLGDGDYLVTVEPKIREALGDEYLIYRSEPFFLEIMPQGIDKAQSLERLLQLLCMTKEEMIACGDGYNDLTMIEYAGLGVAMENAVLPVKEAANYVTASNDKDGVALVIEKFML